MLDQQFWDNRYQTQETGWDLKAVSPPLKSIIDSIGNKNLNLLIPGCGNAYEAEYLVNNGFKNVTVIDIAPSPVKTLQQKFPNGELKIVLGNFFQHEGKYDLILEQTFFCALDPKLREEYVKKCTELLNPGGSIRGVLFNIIFEKDGPPFGGTNDEYKKLFNQQFNLVQFEPCTNSIQPRMGNELLIHFQKKN